jgi:hypothetical protein
MRAVLVLFVAGLSAREVDPISDRMRYEIAAAQRDLLVAKQQYDEALTRLRGRLDLAEKACGEQHFDLQTFTCTAGSK